MMRRAASCCTLEPVCLIEAFDGVDVSFLRAVFICLAVFGTRHFQGFNSQHGLADNPYARLSAWTS